MGGCHGVHIVGFTVASLFAVKIRPIPTRHPFHGITNGDIGRIVSFSMNGIGFHSRVVGRDGAVVAVAVSLSTSCTHDDVE